MKTISKFLLFTLVLLLVGLSVASATGNISDTSQTAEINTHNDITTYDSTDSYDVIENTNKEGSVETINQNKSIEKNNNNKNNLKQAGRTSLINSATYNSYFGLNATSNLVQSGDTLNLNGTFKNLDFTIDKKITLTSLGNNANLYNCKIIITPNGSGSTISNLKIQNDADRTTAIILNSTNVIIENNNVKVNGTFSHAFDAVTNRSTIRNNYFQTTTTAATTQRTHSAMVFCSSYYNNIQNNTVFSDGANCIYFSIYPGQSGLGNGGSSNYNNVTGNKVTGANLGWCYTIQMMGSNNIASHNTVSGGYWGISTSGSNNIIEYNDVQGGERGISTSDSTIVRNNYVHVNGSSTGVYVGGANNKISNNNITTETGCGIDITDGNVLISSNTIKSTGSYGIYSKPAIGGINGVIISDNKITAKKEGIFITKQGQLKYINDIFTDNNHVFSESDYAINYENAGSNDASKINVTLTSSNVLTSNRGTGDVAYLPPKKSNGTISLDTNQVVNVTEGNYTQWFDNGIAKSTILQNATVNLIGTFNNKTFTFSKKVHVVGKNCVINNGKITLTENAHASSVDKVTIKNTEDDYTVHAIEILEVNNCKITNNVIENYGKYESLGIFVFTSSGNTITSNTIKTSGDYVNNGLFVYESSVNKIENNNIIINQSNVHYSYTNEVQFNDKVGTIQEVLHNHGIILLYSSDNTINNNRVTGTSMFKSYTAPSNDCQNSLVGIDLYFQSDNNKVTNNVINLDSYGPFTYGMGVLGGQWGTSISKTNSTYNKFQNNNVTLKGGYFTTGFIAGRNSVNTILDSNVFNIESRKSTSAKGDYAYGVTLENSTSSNITNNKITIKGAAVYSVELFNSGNNNINNNIITATGAYPYGVAGYSSLGNNILSNDITVTKSGTDTVSPAGHNEAIPLGEEGIYFMTSSSNNLVKLNKITTNTDATVKLTSDTRNNKIVENSLVSKSKAGDNSVTNQHSSNNVSNNFIYFVDVKVSPITTNLGEPMTITANVTTTASDVKNLTATFTLGTNNIGTAKINNGKAVLVYDVSTLWRATTYQLTVSVSGNNFQDATAITQVTFIKGREDVTVNVAKVNQLIGNTATLSADITVTSSGGKIGSGQAEFYVDNTKIGTADVKLGKATITYPISNSMASKIYTVKVKYLGSSDYKVAEGTNTLGVQTKSTVTAKEVSGVIGQNVALTATVNSGQKAVSSGTVKILVNNVNVANAAINNGAVNYQYTIPSSYNAGTYDLKYVFDGNQTLSGVTATTKITIKPITPVFSYNTVKGIVGNNLSLVLGVTNGQTGTKLINADGGSVSVLLNGQALTDSKGKVITGSIVNGKVTFKFTAPMQLVGKHNVTFSYAGNNKFDKLTKTYSSGLIIEETMKDTHITINTINSITYGGTAKITGTLSDSTGSKIINTNVIVYINGKSNSVKTDKNGVFTVTTKSVVPGTNNVTVSYTGNELFNSTNARSTFTVKGKVTKITINPIKSVSWGGTVNITGTLSDSTGSKLKSSVSVTLNGKTFSVKTDNNGIFKVSTKTQKPGTGSITVNFIDNGYYQKSTAKATYDITGRTTKITINKIPDTSWGGTATITGTFEDEYGTLFKNTAVTANLNGKSFKVKTNKQGVFTITTKTGKPSTSTLTMSFAGNNYYQKTSTTGKFNVVARKTIFTINNVKTATYGSTIKITGKFQDEFGNVFTNSAVQANVNGKVFKVKTDKKGVFTINANANKISSNTITMSFAGNKYYKLSTKTATYTVNAASTKITINKIANVKKGANAVIKGTFKDQNNKAIVNSALKAKLNGKSFNIKTDAKGVFTITAKASLVGTNNVEISYPGSTYYKASSKKATYVVTK